MGLGLTLEAIGIGTAAECIFLGAAFVRVLLLEGVKRQAPNCGHYLGSTIVLLYFLTRSGSMHNMCICVALNQSLFRIEFHYKLDERLVEGHPHYFVSALGAFRRQLCTVRYRGLYIVLSTVSTVYKDLSMPDHRITLLVLDESLEH